MRKTAPLAIKLSAALLVAGVSFAQPSAATGLVSKPDLQGPWQMTLVGNTGCGLVSMLVKFTLNAQGTATNASVQTHAVGGGACESTLAGQSFTLTALALNGSGKANLSCGPGCGWNFDIQVAADRSLFNVVDVDPANPGNVLSGIAIHQ